MTDRKGILARRLSGFAESASRVLEKSVEEKEPYLPCAAVFRDDGIEPVALAIVAALDSSSLDVDKLSALLGLLATGFDGDLIALMVDTYMSTTEVNPETGERWARGEMGLTFEMGNKSGAIVEALSLCASTADGTVAYVGMPYERHGKHVHWLPQTIDDAKSQAQGLTSGIIPQALVAAWRDRHPLRTTDREERRRFDVLLSAYLGLTGVEIVLTGIEEEEGGVPGAHT